MRHVYLLASISVVTSLAGGCTLYDRASGDDVCGPEADIVSAVQLIDPATLMCDSFSQGTTCDPNCGVACPEAGNTGAIPAIPSWGSCTSACIGLDESTCATNSQCRVALNYDAYYAMGAEGSASGFTSDYLGCYPVDPGPVATGPCDSLDAYDCATNNACAALYTENLTNCAGCSGDEFKGCIPAGQAAGACTGDVACDIAVSCPAGTTPGIEGNCYTGSCIPDAFCPVHPTPAG